MIIPIISETITEQSDDQQNVTDESPIYEENHIFELQNAPGLVLDDDQYIIDPDYQERLGIDRFEDLIRRKR